MPTGFTAKIIEGVTFEEFAMNCARAMGALIMMRDEPLDAPIPDEIPPNTRYYDERLAEATKALKEAQEATVEYCKAQADEEYKRTLKDWANNVATETDNKVKYEAMLAKVKWWKPPTANHTGMKQFMINQIESSIRWDCAEQLRGKPKKLTAKQWRAHAIRNAKYDIKSATRHIKEEIASAADRNKWLKELRESLTSNINVK